jgi:hypothetical protein
MNATAGSTYDGGVGKRPASARLRAAGQDGCQNVVRAPTEHLRTMSNHALL